MRGDGFAVRWEQDAAGAKQSAGQVAELNPQLFKELSGPIAHELDGFQDVEISGFKSGFHIRDH
ncbi:hypothetical protein, partial [Lacticaseibacillus rhamnosus]|uniref:hypothetical protein n=1 Tax=Lacticaseibacillus rhamnosus TaxID=47715 RepID=UPI0015D7DBD2